MSELETSLLRWIPLLPILGTALCIVAATTGRKALAKAAGPGVILAAFVVARSELLTP